MKQTHLHPLDASIRANLREDAATSRARIHNEVTRIKRSAMQEFSPAAGEHLRLLRLALNEAEAMAWQTDYPHLIFPALAAEKAQAAVRWQKRQRAVRGAAPQLWLAE